MQKHYITNNELNTSNSSLGLVQTTSNFSFAESNINELEQRILLICTRVIFAAIFLLLMHAIKWIDLRMYQTICGKAILL